MNGKLGILALAVVALLAANCGGGSVSGTPTSAGSLPATPDAAHLATATSAAPPPGEGVVMVIGQRGDGEGQFQSPQGLALDAQGNVYVADRGNRRVQVFDPQGGFLMAIADARFTGPRYVALDEGGRIYVSDASERVDVFNGRGDPLQSFGQAGSLPSQFSQIADLVVDAAGDLYVVDSGNARVQKFSMLRGLLFTFGDVGEAADSVTRPQGIALDAEGNVYVADAQNGRIVKYDPGGSFLGAFETDIGELRDITLDQQGYIYATDAAARVVYILDNQGRIVMQVGEGQLSDPWGVAVDSDGRVYVADAGHHRVLVLALPGEVPTPGPAPTPVASPTPTLSPVEGVAPWPMYGGNAQHTGASPAEGPVAPNVRWMFRVGLLANSPAIGADGGVYFGSLDGNIYALDSEGVELWRAPFGQVSGVPALSAEGVIYVGVASPVEEMFYALNRGGRVAWSYHLESHIVESSPVVGPDGTVYLAATNPQTDGGSVVALNADGSERWSYEVGSRLPFSPALGADGTLYVGARNGNLYALNPDGSPKWQTPLGAVSSSVAIGADGTIYLGSASDYQALNPTDGAQVWAFSPVDGQADSTPAVGPGGRIYLTASSNELYAVNPDGTVAWTFSAEP
ncbi:MAG: PQQ-binding-like beta-propeller repeat protein, partial [Anaerolineae bacterium]|nr:PQQ-binding-like beta-propeller repeat protein [Anaerolineae bacterium]